MAANKSSYLRSALVKHAVGKTSFTMPAAAYLALYTSDPTVSDTGTEVAGGSYARQSITWGTEANGEITNSNVVSFTDLPAATITHWGIRDASSSGNLLYFGQLEVALTVTSGQDLAFAANNILIAES